MANDAALRSYDWKSEVHDPCLDEKGYKGVNLIFGFGREKVPWGGLKVCSRVTSVTCWPWGGELGASADDRMYPYWKPFRVLSAINRSRCFCHVLRDESHFGFNTDQHRFVSTSQLVPSA